MISIIGGVRGRLTVSSKIRPILKVIRVVTGVLVDIRRPALEPVRESTIVQHNQSIVWRTVPFSSFADIKHPRSVPSIMADNTNTPAVK